MGVIIRDGTAIRGGPGTDSIVSHYVDRGVRVEVYQVSEDGWLAIRPTAESFSWVRADQMNFIDSSSVAEARRDGVEVWVGSLVKNQKQFRSAVTLRQGEKVEVLGQRSLTSHEGEPAAQWLKIAPPAGEFRWVASDDVEPIDEEDDDVDGANADESTSDGFGEPTYVAVGDATGANTEQNVSSVRRHTGFHELASNAPRYDALTIGGAARRLAFRKPAAASSSDERPTRRRSPSHENADAELPFAEALDQLDLELSMIVALPLEQWDLTSLRQRAERLTARGTTPLERGRARWLLEQIDEFIQLQQRGDEVADQAGDVVRASATVSAPADGAIGTGVEPLLAESDVDFYDAAGKLLRVHTSRPSMPPYAVADAAGKRVLYYVSPAPGLNLHRYVNQEVGIYGQRRAVPGLKTPHITASRVVDLNRHRH
jgi:hypothetical protein